MSEYVTDDWRIFVTRKKRNADEVTGTERLKSSRKIKDDEKKPDVEVLSDNEIILMQRYIGSIDFVEFFLFLADAIVLAR